MPTKLTKAKRIPPAFGVFDRAPRNLLGGGEAAIFLCMKAEDFDDLHLRGKGPHFYNVAGKAFFDTSDLKSFKAKLIAAKKAKKAVRHDA